jgi:hypothetical protein
MPQETLTALVLVSIVLALSRHWNFSSAVGFTFLPVAAWLTGNPPLRMVVYLAAMLSVVGIKRLVFLPRARRKAARRRATMEAPTEQPEIRTPGPELR